jgi:hypothetical protein
VLVKKHTVKSLIAVAVTLTLSGADADAKPPATQVVCQTYPSAQQCVGGQPSCTLCHVAPPQRNTYGSALEMNLAPGMPRPLSDADFIAGLPAALAAAEALDSDGDGVSNRDEILAGTQPADPNSKPGGGACQGGDNPQYSVCTYDLRHAYRKVLLDFCGASPTYPQVRTFVGLGSDDERRAFIDAEIDRCTATEFWRGKNGQLWKVAHPKVRPVGSLKAGEDKGGVEFADYYDDYALFAYSQTDDHDAREVLTADFFVRRDVNPTRYTKVTTLASQFVDQTHRAGNMTTSWTLGYFVMFTALPRNAASQMYRAYLGLDIAKQEGLEATGYVPNRLETFFPTAAPRITQTPERGVLFGQPVANLREWATVGANSDAFAVSTTKDYWKLLIGHEPQPEENAEFVATWQRFKTTHQYRVQKLLHDIVKTEAYGAP